MPAKQKTRRPARRQQPARRPARPVLGNDPFERGAAPRVPIAPPLAAAPPPQPPAPQVEPSAPPRPAAGELASRIDRVEEQVGQALDQAEAKLAALAARADAGRHARELGEVMVRLLPALQERLRAVSSLWGGLFEGAGPRDAHGMDRSFVERVAPLLEFLYRTYWRVEARAIDQVPSQGPAVLVANHGGNLPWDALVLQLALAQDHPARRELRPLLDEEACRLPLLGWAALRFGAVPATPENGQALLQDGKLVGVFPEGSAAGRKPWGERYRLRRFGRGGFVKLALRAGAPIVPCAIVGSEEVTLPASRPGWLAERLGLPFLSLSRALPLGPFGLLPLPSRWSIRFGAPIETRRLGPEAAEDPAQVAELTEKVRSEVQKMLDRDIARRISVFL